MKTWRRGDGPALLGIATGTALSVALLTPTLAGLLGAHVPRPTTEAAVAVAAPMPPAPLSPPAGVAFYASSLGEGWSFEGDYSGRVSWHGNGLEVDVPEGLIRQESADGPATHVVGVALALAEDADDGEAWRIVRQGPLHPTRDAVHKGSDLWMRDLRLRVDGLTDEDLEGRWLVIVQQLEVEDATGSHPAWSYVHADRDLLARLMGGILGGC